MERLIIPIFDTWFGVSVHPAAITLLSNLSTEAWHSFGRELAPDLSISPQCTQARPILPPMSLGNLNASIAWPCNVFPEMVLARGDAAADILLGDSAVNSLLNNTGTVPTRIPAAPFQNTTIYLIADPRSSTGVDFQAKTMGISTTCQMMTSKCAIGNGELGPTFRCPNEFNGNFYQTIPSDYGITGNSFGLGASAGIGFAHDAQLSNYSRVVNVSDGLPTDRIQVRSKGQITSLLEQNPIYFGAWSAGRIDRSRKSTPLANISGSGKPDPEVFPNGSNISSWLVQCSATIYDVNYTYINGSVRNLQLDEAVPEWGALYSAPLAWAYYLPQDCTAMGDAANKAIWLAEYSTELANIVRDLATQETPLPFPNPRSAVNGEAGLCLS